MPPKPQRIGLTGGIGTGKSTVAKIFQVLKVPVYDSDERAKILMNTSHELIKKIKQEFGNESYREGKLNRSYLADKVFSDQERLSRLNDLVHPAVGEDFNEWSTRELTASSFVIKEAALLFETGAYKELDETYLVTSPISLRKERIKKRDPFRSDQEIENIINKQWSDDRKLPLATEVIKNDEVNPLIPQVLAIYKKLFYSQ